MTVLRFILRPEDGQFTRTKKKIILTASITSIVLSYTCIAVMFLPHYVFAAAGGTAILVQLLVERRVRDWVVEMGLYLMTFTVLYSDLLDVAGGRLRIWSGVVVILDVTLLCDLKSRVGRNISIAVVTWLVLAAVEATLRFGIFDLDLPSMYTQQERREISNCETLPCAVAASTAISVLSIQIAVFLLDYHFTRGFATRCHAESHLCRGANLG
eukprot:TRINITY_DN10102_c0_g2_i1.p1 TRINITY_DN10102_c0_g2~~TRINITY_DN10102_c0_g2_i1.p1  ORF type:complete len:213 (+),score=25.91 TRINITY_DN10102_c0_g2_i1:29-667(+)